MKLGRIIRTIYYLKFIQILYQLKYRVNTPKWREYKCSQNLELKLGDSIGIDDIYVDDSFTFLNKSKSFEKINWNFLDYGKLWCYNLNYFDFLKQNNLSKENGLSLIRNFIGEIKNSNVGLEPYPTSLRGMNWIQFLSRHNLDEEIINDSLFSQYMLLSKRLEYHLLGNHLLENGFSMLWGAVYFKNSNFLEISKKILKKELKEQVLVDGAHFELSPMYHSIMLERVLDAYNLLSNNDRIAEDLKKQLKASAEKMLSWLEQICVGNSIPLLNDSAEGIATTPDKLFNYAKNLGIYHHVIPLSDSGYRKFIVSSIDLIVDVGVVGPSYIPGHAHADILNFVLYVGKKPIIVDSGTSTYEWGNIRNYERGTRAHNIVQFGEEEQSEVWGSHRVGRRAKRLVLKDSANELEASVKGFAKNKRIHVRNFSISNDKILIVDKIGGGKNAVARIHFHPEVKLSIFDNKIIVDQLEISIEGAIHLELTNYQYGVGFNKRIDAKCLEVKFQNQLKTTISIL